MMKAVEKEEARKSAQETRPEASRGSPARSLSAAAMNRLILAAELVERGRHGTPRPGFRRSIWA
jgi:hypothetical protein